MKKLSLDELMAKSSEVASEELMSKISGGTSNDCHVEPLDEMPQPKPLVRDGEWP